MSSKKRTLPEMFGSISPEINVVEPPPKIAVSTLRGFQLLDSSSDDISSSSDEEEDQSGKHNPIAHSSGLYISNNVSIPCPSLDEMCEEFFQNEKDKKLETQPVKRYNGGENHNVQNEEKNFGKHNHMIEDPPRPSHHYFFSTDARVRDLVRSRLPNFSPLDDSTNSGVMPPRVESIDYMSQFGKNDGACMSQTTTRKRRGKEAPVGGNEKKRMAAVKTSGGRIGKAGGGVCSEKSRRLSSGAPYMEKPSTVDSLSWLTPKSETKPKNMGKLRVHAGRSTGFWYTAEGSKKVYVTSTGEELSGSCAYRQYMKENRSKKKTGPKKKN